MNSLFSHEIAKALDHRQKNIVSILLHHNSRRFMGNSWKQARTYATAGSIFPVSIKRHVAFALARRE